MFGTPVTGEKEYFVSKWRLYMVSSILFPVIPDLFDNEQIHSVALHGGFVMQRIHVLKKEVVTWLLRSAWPRKPSEGLTTLPLGVYSRRYRNPYSPEE